MIKKSLFAICILFLSFNQLIFAQKEESNVIVCEDFHITRTLLEINAEFPVNSRKIEREMKKKMKKKIVESKDKKHRDPQHFEFSFEKDGYAFATDSTIIQKNDGSRPGPTQKINIAGQSSSSRPMDPSGAAGNDYYVQIVNATVYKIYNKTTGAVTTTGTLGNLWTPATGNSGDPIVMYDRFADRWFLAQFGTGNKIYIAISTTSDPAGSYYTYAFTSPQFPDYLKFSIWQDGYYMTSNQGMQRVFAFERDAMLIGNAGARSIYKTFTPPSGGGFFCPLTGDSDGNAGLAAVGTPCPIFSYSDNAWGGSVIDGIQIYQMAVNWVPTTPTATISFVGAIPTASFDGSYNSSWNDVSQPGTTQKLDGIGGTLSYRAQWRKWATYNSVVLAWPVKISTTQRSVMWCELRQNQSTMAWTTYQQGVFTPDAYTRWLASIAMDDNGSIGLCYLKSGATTIYPSLGYTGRLANDPLNTMTFAETIAAVGTAAQTGGINRVGDYSQTTLDPDGSTFWHTGEYMGGTSTSPARTRIYSYQLILPSAAVVSVTSSDSDNSICAGSTVTFTASATNGGTNPSYQWYVNNSPTGSNSTTFTTSTLTNGSIVSCVMTSNLSGVSSNPATSNSITVSVVNPVSPSVSIFGNQAVCAGQSITLGSFSSNAGSAPSYQWILNGTNVGTNISSYSFVPSNGDILSLVLTSNSTCVTSATANASPINMAVNPLPPTPSISQNINTLTSSSATGNQWYYNGTLISGATNQSYTASLVGVYTVLVSNNEGCSLSSVGITVSEFAEIGELDSYIFSIFPNPSQGDFSISFTAISGSTYTFKVYNEAGQLIYEDRLENQNGKIIKDVHLGELASGMYNLTLSNGKTESSKKIIIKRN